MPTVALIGPELFPIPPIRGGAAELFIEKTAACLKTWQPVVIGVSDPELPGHEVRGGVEYFRIPLTGWRRWLYSRYRHYFPVYDREVARIVSRVQPDLIHVHNRPLLARYLKEHLNPGIPLILHMHNLNESLGKREGPDPKTIIPVEGFIGCSRFVVERETSRLGAGARLRRVVYNGVEGGSFASRWENDARVSRAREPHYLTDEPTVLFVGKLRESKGVHILLAAMERVWQSLPLAVLVLVGGTEFGRGRTMRETPFLKDLRQQIARARGRVHLTGFIPPADMPGAYLLGDVFVGPSQIEEGLGLVFLEAAAAGLPVIASRQGGIPEVVRDGETGLLLARKDDAVELADKIIGLLRQQEWRKRLGQQGREWVLKKFSWEKIARVLEGVYDEVSRDSQVSGLALARKGNP
jgi:spore coat protein SA